MALGQVDDFDWQKSKLLNGVLGTGLNIASELAQYHIVHFLEDKYECRHWISQSDKFATSNYPQNFLAK